MKGSPGLGATADALSLVLPQAPFAAQGLGRLGFLYSESSKGGMKVGRMEDPLYKDS